MLGTYRSIRESKAHRELKLPRQSCNNNKIIFFRYVRNKCKIKEATGPLLGNNVEALSEDKDKAERLNTYFA